MADITLDSRTFKQEKFFQPTAVAPVVPYVRVDSGSTGTTFSANLPDASTLGTLLVTIPANSGRAFVFVENQSAGDLTLVGDVGDGTQIWHRILTGVAAGKQGADWSSSVFFGRIRVYGASGAQVSAGEF